MGQPRLLPREDGAVGPGQPPGGQSKLPHPAGGVLVRLHPPPAVAEQPRFAFSQRGGHGRVELPQAVAAAVRVHGAPRGRRPGEELGDRTRVVAVNAIVEVRVAVGPCEELLPVAEHALAHRLAQKEVAAADEERPRPQVRRVSPPNAQRADGELFQPEHAAGLLQGDAVDEHLGRVAVQLQNADRAKGRGTASRNPCTDWLRCCPRRRRACCRSNLAPRSSCGSCRRGRCANRGCDRVPSHRPSPSAGSISSEGLKAGRWPGKPLSSESGPSEKVVCTAESR